jgi:hypothetical protein
MNRVSKWWKNNDEKSAYKGEYVYVLTSRPDKVVGNEQRWDVIWFSELDASKTKMFSAIEGTFHEWVAYTPDEDDVEEAVLAVFGEHR